MKLLIHQIIEGLRKVKKDTEYSKILSENSVSIEHLKELINLQGERTGDATLYYKDGLNIITEMSSIGQELECINAKHPFLFSGNKEMDLLCGMQLIIGSGISRENSENFTFFVGTLETNYDLRYPSLSLRNSIARGEKPEKVIKITLEDGIVYHTYDENVILFKTQAQLRKFDSSINELVKENSKKRVRGL